MTIDIGVGLGDVVFGMTPEDVIAVLGQPEKIDPDFETTYYYNDFLLTLYFDPDQDCKLHYISVYNPEARLFGERLINQRKTDVLAILRGQGCTDLKFEDDCHDEKVRSGSTETTFTFEFGRLRSIQFGALFDQDDQRIWPERSRRTVLDHEGWRWSPPTDDTAPAEAGEVRIGAGLGDLVLSTTQADVVAVMGKPDRVSESEWNVSYYFFEPMLITKFAKNDNCLLYSVQEYDPRTSLFGRRIMNQTKNTILDLLRQNGCDEVIQEDYGYSELVISPETGCWFWFEYDRLRSVEVQRVVV